MLRVGSAVTEEKEMHRAGKRSGPCWGMGNQSIVRQFGMIEGGYATIEAISRSAQGKDMEDLLADLDVPSMDCILMRKFMTTVRRALVKKEGLGNFAIRGQMDLSAELHRRGLSEQKMVETTTDKKLDIALDAIADFMEEECEEEEAEITTFYVKGRQRSRQEIVDMLRTGRKEPKNKSRGRNKTCQFCGETGRIAGIQFPDDDFFRVNIWHEHVKTCSFVKHKHRTLSQIEMLRAATLKGLYRVKMPHGQGTKWVKLGNSGSCKLSKKYNCKVVLDNNKHFCDKCYVERKKECRDMLEKKDQSGERLTWMDAIGPKAAFKKILSYLPQDLLLSSR